jgi:DNA-binding response OmpR family regulator
VPRSKGSRKVILIVDNDLGFLVWLGLALAKHGFVSIPACGAQSAHQAVEALDLTIDLIILNFEIPGIMELIHKLKREAPKLKLIAIEDTSTGIHKTADARIPGRR